MARTFLFFLILYSKGLFVVLPLFSLKTNFFSATKKGFISLLYLCTRNDDGSMAERSKAAHCSLGDEGDACQSKNVLNRQVPEVLCEQSDQRSSANPSASANW